MAPTEYPTVCRCAIKKLSTLRTFNSSELVERLEAGGVVDVVGVESDAEEVAVGADSRRA